MGWIWLAPAASFVGAGLAYVGARVGTRQREDQRRREEWGRRFTFALEAIKSADLRSRVLGMTLLAELAMSELASAEERSLANSLLSQNARFDSRGTDLRLAGSGPQLDDSIYVEDDYGDHDYGGGSDL